MAEIKTLGCPQRNYISVRKRIQKLLPSYIAKIPRICEIRGANGGFVAMNRGKFASQTDDKSEVSPTARDCSITLPQCSFFLSLSLFRFYFRLYRAVLQPRGIIASFLSRSAAFRVARIRLQRIEAAAGRRVRRDLTDRSVFPWKPTYLPRLDLYCLLPP